MKKRVLFVTILLMVSVFLKAQQDPQFSQYMFTQLSINPGFAGSDDKINFFILNRQQWVGFMDKGTPQISVFNADAAFTLFKLPLGAGLSIKNDIIGFNNDTEINISLAYKLNLGKGVLGIGIKGGIVNTNISGEWKYPDSDGENDPAIPKNQKGMAMVDLGFGLFYKTNDLYLGIASTHLNQAQYDFQQGKEKLVRHYYVTAGYNMPFTNPLLEFKPSVLVQSDGTYSQLSINALLEYNKKFWGGVSWRTDNAIVGVLGIELFNWVKVGYSYDFVTSDIMSYNSGSHEIMMGFSFDVKKEKTPEKYKSIRFL
jgi:type IX secretion system PorP/SprF family membrane protein